MKKLFTVLGLVLVCAGCATSTVESRRQERPVAYASLPPETRAMVDQGQIRVGMNEDAVYIAWGKPSEVLQREDGKGLRTIWHYYGATLQEHRYWNYRDVPGSNGHRFLERYLDTEYDPRSYVRAEITFQNGVVKEWRTLPTPVN